MRNDYAEYTVILKAVSDETRLRIVHMLSTGEKCACKILENFNFTQPTLSYHMKILTESGLVDAQRHGAWVHYRLNSEKIADILEFWNEIAKTIEANISCRDGICE